MRDRHGRDGGAAGHGSAIAAVDDGRPGNDLAETGFTHIAVTVEQRIGAQQAEIVQRLHDPAPSARAANQPAGEISGKCCGNARSAAARPAPAAAARQRRPDSRSPAQRRRTVHRRDLVIVDEIFADLVPLRAQHVDFGRDALVLAAAVLIEIMGDEDLHGALSLDVRDACASGARRVLREADGAVDAATGGPAISAIMARTSSRRAPFAMLLDLPGMPQR